MLVKKLKKLMLKYITKEGNLHFFQILSKLLKINKRQRKKK